MSKSIGRLFSGLYRVGAMKRTIIVWLLLQAVLWVFLPRVSGRLAAGCTGSSASAPWLAGGQHDGLYRAEKLHCTAAHGAGNLLVRFGVVTPGPLVLDRSGCAIGWLAGTNGFEVPFPSVAAANMQYLRIGLWETSAYAVFCGLTLTKSLLVADSFPAKEWAEKAYSALFEVFRCRKGTGSLDAVSWWVRPWWRPCIWRGEAHVRQRVSFQPQQLHPSRTLLLVELYGRKSKLKMGGCHGEEAMGFLPALSVSSCTPCVRGSVLSGKSVVECFLRR